MREGQSAHVNSFYKLDVLPTKVPFKISELIALYIQLAFQFGLIGVTLNLSSPFGSPLQSFLCNIRLDYDW